MAERAKHAHGSRKNLENAIAQGIVNEFDVLFLSGEDESNAIGWVSKDGEAIIIDPVAEVSKLEASIETELANKVSVEEVDTKIDTVVTEKVETVVTEKVTKEVETVVNEKVETVITEKVDTVVNEKVETLVTEKVESTVVQALAKTDKYEVLDVPKGTLVDYNDKEIRIMVPHDAVWTKQAVGEGGDTNSHYMTFRTYAPNDDAVGYIEHLGDQVDPEILTDLRTDESGRRYQPTWLALAQYDAETDTWTYHGAKSTEGKYMGWNYQIDWYDADGVMIASDSIRINLSNEDCHSVIEPYYVGSAIAEKVDAKVEEVVETKVETIVETKVDTAIDEKVEGAVNTAKQYTDSKIAEIENSYGIIEF